MSGQSGSSRSSSGVQAPLNGGHAAACRQLYTRATQIDPFDGAMPEQDTGTDNTSVATVAKRHGLISRFALCVSP
jgi:hypothetical protein